MSIRERSHARAIGEKSRMPISHHVRNRVGLKECKKPKMHVILVFLELGCI